MMRRPHSSAPLFTINKYSLCYVLGILTILAFSFQCFSSTAGPVKHEMKHDENPPFIGSDTPHKPESKVFPLLEHLKKQLVDLDDLVRQVRKPPVSGSKFHNNCSLVSRRHVIDDACSRLSDREEMTSSSYWRLLVDDRNHVMYCVVPKAGCTTMKTLLAQNSPHFVQSEFKPEYVHNPRYLRELGLRFLSSYPMESIKEKLRSYQKLLLVRHPLSRLYSAYIDKVDQRKMSNPHFFHEVVGEYYPNSVGDDGRLQLNFTQFLQLVATEYKTRKFINRHWVSQYELCRPCDIHYDHVARIETMDSESPALSSMLQISANVRIVKNNANSNITNNNELIRQFRKAGRMLTQRIAELYELDFRMFGYNWNWSRGPICTNDVINTIGTLSQHTEDCCAENKR